MTKNRVIRGSICTLCGGLCWGVSGTVGQYVFSNCGVSSQWLTMARMLGSGVLLLIVALLKTPQNMTNIWKNKGDAVRLVMFGLFGLMICQYTYLTAIYHSNSATATVLQYVGEVLVLAWVCIRARRLPSIREYIGVALALGGVFLLATHGHPSELVLSTEGLAWGIAAAFGMAFYTLLPGNLVEKYGCPVCTGYGMLIGGVVFFLLMRGWEMPFPTDIKTLLLVALITVVGTAMAFALYLQGVSDLGGVRAGLLGCSEPVCATILSAVWLGTEFAVEDIIAFAIIIAMVILMSVKGKKEIKPSAQAEVK